MDLTRLGTAKFEKEQDDVTRDEKIGKISVFFRNFGHGTDRTGDYKVGLSWGDVENIIIEFALMGDPDALELRAAQKLAEAAEAAGWTPNSN
jgi:hypothetical protein